MATLAEMPHFDLPPGHTAASARANASGKFVVTRASDMPRLGWLARITGGGILLTLAGLLLLALAVAMGVTSFHAQFAYILATKHQRVPSMLEALGLDCGAVIFSLLGIALGMLGRRAVVERVLVIACALGSCGMNALNANLGSPRSVAVWALPPVLFALSSDRLVAVVRRTALGPKADADSQRSAWAMAGRAVLYLMRFAIAPLSTATGARQALLAATPLPGAAPQTPPADPVGAETRAIIAPKRKRAADMRQTGKTARFLARVAEVYGDLAHFPLEKVSPVAKELAPEVGLDWGAARTALRKAVLAAQGGEQA